MEKFHKEQSSIDTNNYMNKMFEKEKIERLTNNKIKCLEATIKIVKSF